MSSGANSERRYKKTRSTGGVASHMASR
uniref:Uncharacterized protein n=1 Tax=Arundo donax TaxID=35708 RepID=A0A0A9AGN5_ARUDO